MENAPGLMDNIPFFVETDEAVKQNFNICSRIRILMFKQKIAPLPYASTYEEVEDILGNLKKSGKTASIFIVNTYEAKDFIPRLEPLMGEVPVLFLRRSLQRDSTGLSDMLQPGGDAPTMQVLEKLTIRLTSVWTFGGKQVDHVAATAVRSITSFFNDGEFRHIEVNKPRTQ